MILEVIRGENPRINPDKGVNAVGRPRKQTVDYFPHFVSTDSRTKFILEQQWGNDGYAFWFKLLELLGRSEGHCYDCSQPADKMYLVALTKVTEEQADDILNMLATRGNIDRELWTESKIIWCQSLVDNLQDVYSKRTVSAPRRPGSEPEPEKPAKPEKEPEPEPAPEQPKKRGRPRRTSSLTVKQQELFGKFYAAYPKRVDPAAAERAWAKINPEPDEAFVEKVIQAIEDAKRYDSRFRERQYIPNPATWLNAKGYMSEYGGNGYGGYETDKGAVQQQTPGGFRPSGGFRGGE